MEKYLVIVESPTKAKTLGKFLGGDYVVEASGGHIKDLPRKQMGVDIEKNFAPVYEIIPGRKKIVTKLKKVAKEKEAIYLAADPDREGEMICWHLKEILNNANKIFRVAFHEITKDAVDAAFKHPEPIDAKKVDAQQARRILDRLVGYNLSPLLWKKVARGLSAGRVQSVAVRLIVERERGISDFVPEEYWQIEADLKKGLGGNVFVARLEKVNNEKFKIATKDQTDGILKELKKAKYVVNNIEQRQKRRNPQAPFITSKLQQEAFNKLRFSASKTMRVAQQLYEGIEIGDVGSVGLITYMRTDSVRLAPSAVQASREFIQKNYGKQFLPAKPHYYRSKKGAQEAHEAIRPALPLRKPADIQKFLSEDQYKLYQLVFNNFIASQMNPAVYLITTVDIEAGKYTFRATGSVLKFAGFKIVYGQEDNQVSLPELSKGDELILVKLHPRQCFTEPPPHYSDASLVKALEEKGIGRPSTYAPIIRTITARDYVRRRKGYFYPTELGVKVTEILIKNFPKILNIKFTREMEDDLDQIEEGRMSRHQVLHIFYQPFIKQLEVAKKKIKKEETLTDEVCELCGKPMVIKWGRKGKFLSCSAFPQCKHSRSITTGVKCPQEGCSGELVERRGYRGRMFYGCTSYPQCRYTANQLPTESKK